MTYEESQRNPMMQSVMLNVVKHLALVVFELIN